MMTRKQQHPQRRVEIDAKPPEQYVRDRSRIQKVRKDKAGELASGLMPWVRQYPGAAILSLQWECTVWTRARNACLAIVGLSPDAARMRDLARNLSVYLQQKADGYRGTTTPQASSSADRAGTPYSSDVAEDYAEIFRMIAARFPNAARMGADSLQIADCLTQRILLLRPTLHLFPKDATAADAETAWRTYFRTTEELPFHMRKRIADPLYPGQSAIITLDLAGLVETKIKMRPDLRRALSSGGANPQGEKFCQLPAVVYEKAYRTKGGETFEGFLGRVEYALRARGFTDTPQRKITVQKEDDNGNPVKRRIFVPREVPLSDDNDEGGARPRMVHHAKHSPTPVDTTSFRVLHDLELREVFERAKPTARQYDITLRKEIDREPAKQIADEYGVSPSTVYNTVAQTQHKFRAAREEVETTEKIRAKLTREI